MAKITRLASTLIARYYPSKTLIDAFYMDGRLFGKRESRNADITIDKEEKGFFFSVFSHPTIPGYEPGMVPPYEPQLRAICNEVKFGRKPIDEMISGFLSTAVDITGKMKLQDQDNRAPYFSGIIVHDSEAFAVTIGTGLAFLYRNDALYPLTDAGIPMEPIDAFGNRVGDFYNYVSSKTANALWSNITTLSVDDCIILCNKAVYDALGQRELLRILDEAEDQCDAAGTVITQAAANMPNTPMQFSISFVESIVADEKKGFFSRFSKKNKEEDDENMSIKSTFEGGIIGAAAGAVASAGFQTGIDAADVASASAASSAAAISFGDAAVTTAAGAAASSMPEIKIPDEAFGMVVPDKPETPKQGVEFLDSSVDVVPTKEVSAEDMMKSLFGDMEASKVENDELQKKAEDDAKSISPFVMEEPTPAPSIITEGTAFAPQSSEIPADSPFVSAFNPFATPATTPETMEPVAEVPFDPKDDKMMDTKTVNAFDSLFAQHVQSEGGISSNGIIAAALREMQAESSATIGETAETPSDAPVVPEVPDVKVITDVVDKADETPVVEAPVVAPVEVAPVETPVVDSPVVTETPVVAEAPVEVAPVIPAVDVTPDVKPDISAAAKTTPEPSVAAPMFTIDDEPAQPTDVKVDSDEITFTQGNEVLEFGDSKTSAPFNPYGIGNVDDIESMNPMVVFPGTEGGDFVQPEGVSGGEPVMRDEDNQIDPPSFDWKEEGSPLEQIESDIPTPKFEIDPTEKTVNPVDNVSFPVSTAPNAEPTPVEPVVPGVPFVPEAPVAPVQPVAPVDEAPIVPETPVDEGYVLPFENAVYAEPEPEVKAKDIPDMPLYGGQTYDAPTYAVNSEQPLDDMSTQAYSVGEYAYNEDITGEQAPYQTYGSEVLDDGMLDPTGYAQQPAPDDYGYQAPVEGAYAPEYGTPDYGTPEGYVDPAYGGQIDNGYVDPAYAEGGYGAPVDPSYQPETAGYSPLPETEIPVDGTGDDGSEWINNILGLGTDDSTGGMNMNYIDPNADMSSGRPQTRPGGTPGTKPGVKKPAPNGRPNPNKPGGKKKKFKLSRNGILFFAFVGVLLISLIVIISLIAKSCSSDETKVKTTEPSATAETVIETVPTPTPVPDPTAPIGVFVFSDYTGYRTWYDLFSKVYGIQIEGTTDSRIATICQYNGAGEGYVPASGDTLLLPPIGVINGSVPVANTTDAPVDTGAETAETAEGAIEGTPSMAE